MAWVYLIAAGLFEIGWPVGLKWAQEPRKLVIGVLVAVVCMSISGLLLFLAQKEIALGTAYAVWTGIGAAGTFLARRMGVRRSRQRHPVWGSCADYRGRHHAQARALADLPRRTEGSKRVELVARRARARSAPAPS
jgi:multidrug transporter EmrE-like cation transporter